MRKGPGLCRAAAGVAEGRQRADLSSSSCLLRVGLDLDCPVILGEANLGLEKDMGEVEDELQVEELTCIAQARLGDKPASECLALRV